MMISDEIKENFLNLGNEIIKRSQEEIQHIPGILKIRTAVILHHIGNIANQETMTEYADDIVTAMEASFEDLLHKNDILALRYALIWHYLIVNGFLDDEENFLDELDFLFYQRFRQKFSLFSEYGMIFFRYLVVRSMNGYSFPLERVFIDNLIRLEDILRTPEKKDISEKDFTLYLQFLNTCLFLYDSPVKGLLPDIGWNKKIRKSLNVILETCNENKISDFERYIISFLIEKLDSDQFDIPELRGLCRRFKKICLPGIYIDDSKETFFKLFRNKNFREDSYGELLEKSLQLLGVFDRSISPRCEIFI